ncbi:MAG: protein kinase domain-containing protein [Planctomycetaceae bacterium]
MRYPKLTLLAASIGLFLMADRAIAAPVAITIFALLASRLSGSDLVFAIFAFAAALVARGAIERSEESLLTMPWDLRGPGLSMGEGVVTIVCLIILFAFYRYRELVAAGRSLAISAVALPAEPTESLAHARVSVDPGSTDSDDLNFTVSDGHDEWTAADQPTAFMLPEWTPKQSHLTYDVNPDEVLGKLVSRLMPQQLLHCLTKANIQIPTAVETAASQGESTAQLVDALIAEGILTKLQAMLICGAVPELLWIGNYEVLDRIGRGGMAIVLRVRDRHTRHIYALKLLANLNTIDDVMRNRFLREMEAVRGLAHPNIAVARAVGEHHQSLYIAMEWVQGDNLACYVQQHGPLAAQEAIDFIRQAAAALQHAHQRGLIHRDVKPANLMLDKNRVIKLVDMGLARFADSIERKLDANSKGWRTDTGHLMGTIDYMAPEQAIDLGLADQRSDIYSLGCTLFYLLTGASHLRGQTQRGRAVGLVRQTGMQNLIDVRKDLPECMYVLANRMMAAAPEARYQTIIELMAAIDSCATQLGMPTQIGRSYRVLVVEDSPTQSLMICQQLKSTSRHFIPIDVPTVALACDRLQTLDIDLVLLDLNLPDSSGIPTIERVRQVHATVPILVLTNTDDPEVGMQCIAAGADDFLPKNALEASTLERHILLTLSRRCSTLT